MNASGIAWKYIPSIEEIRISSTVSRRGYVNFLDENETGWLKKYVVRRQDDERDTGALVLGLRV